MVGRRERWRRVGEEKQGAGWRERGRILKKGEREGEK